MASQRTKPRKSSKDGRSASQKTDKYRFAQNVAGEGTVAEREYLDYAVGDADLGETEPDVLLAVPVLKVDSIHLELDELDAHVALKAFVLDLVKLNVGVDVHLGEVKLDIKGVEAQALLKVRLDHVAAVVDRVMTTIDRSPELVESLGKAVEDVGAGAGHTLGESGEAVEDVGEGTEEALKQLGPGAQKALEGVGGGAGQAVGEVGQGAGQAVGDVGEGAGQAVGNVDQLAGGLGQTVGQVGQGAGEAVGGVGQGAGEAAGGVGQAAGGLGQALGGGDSGGGGAGAGDGAGAGGASGTDVAKLAAKTVAHEIGSVAADEAKELGVAAAKKAKELGERRRQRKADKHHATEAALRLAQEQGVDLDNVDGTRAEGRITVNDVRAAQDE